MATQTAQATMPLANCSVKKPYIGRRTGKVINIVARRDVNGFENIDDYFPDSDLENGENTEKDQTAITTTSKSEVSGKVENHASGENVDPKSDTNISEPVKSITANSLEDRCSPDSAFGAPKDDLPTSDKVGSSADKASVSRSSSFNSDGGRYKYGKKNGDQVSSGNNISLQTNDAGMAVSRSTLEEDDNDDLHATKKRLRFSISPEANEKEKSLLPVEKAITNKDQSGNITDDEDSLMVVENPKTRAPRTTSTKKTASRKKTTKQAKTSKPPQIETDTDSSNEDICKSNDTFVTLKKKTNMTASKLDSNSNSGSISTTMLSIKPPASRKNTKSKIPVKKSRVKVGYPKRNTRKNVKMTKPMQGEENSKNLDEEEDTAVSKVQITSNSSEFLASETQDLECPEGNKVGDHDEMSVQSEPDPAARQSPRLAEVAKTSSKLGAGAKSGKTVVKRKSQSTEAVVGKSAAKKKANPITKPSVAKTTKHQSKPITSAAKARVTRNSTSQQNTEHNVGSSEESLDEASSIKPIKAPSINIEKDGQSEIFDDCLASNVGDEIVEEGGISDEESADLVVKPPKKQARKVNLESVATQETEVHADGLRRSCRHRVPPLQYWKNERIEYERRKSGWIVKDVIINPSPQVVPRKRKNTTKYVTSHAKKRAAANNFEESELSLANVPEGLEEEVDPVGTVFNPDLMEQVKIKLVHSSRMLDFQSLVQEDTDEDSPSILVHKFFSQNQFGAGQVLLRPGAEKGRQHVRKDTMVFHIISGRLLVTIQDDSFVLAKGSSFFIPHGNVYNLKNLDTKKDACLFFTQLKGS